MKIITKFSKFLSEYKIQHTAPASNHSPMNNLTGTYPDDIYSNNGAKYYGVNSGDYLDNFCIDIIKSAKNKPNKLVKVYRAVPYINKDIDKQIKDLKYIIDYKNTFRFFPTNKREIIHKLEDKYENIFKELGYNARENKIIEDIKNQIIELETQKQVPIKINSGDWVTISKEYAIEHGKSELGDFKILSKTVKASQLYTDGNSIFEWGYNVSPY